MTTPAVHKEYFDKTVQEDLIRLRFGGDTGKGEDRDAGSDGGAGETPLPCSELEFKGSDGETKCLDDAGARRYVSAAALLNYISPDRPEIQFGVKECFSKSSSPTEADESRLKRICRFLVERPREVIRMGWQKPVSELTICSDSDFAGCARTRKSTAGGVAMMGRHSIKAWSKTISVLALSSGEAELISVVRASTEALGLQALYLDLGREVKLHILSDATAAIGMVGRLGIGRVRHLAVSDLWVQSKARSGVILFSKVDGKSNPSDSLTKAVDFCTMMRHLETMCIHRLNGRPEVAPKSKGTEES